MTSLNVVTRRIAWLMLIAMVGGAALAWLREREASPELAPPQWPPLDPDEPRAAAGSSAAWSAPQEDGSCPPGYEIKVNTNSGIFHVPGGRFYERSTPHRCYATAEAAVADGYRQSKS
jgi:hypothetical protein